MALTATTVHTKTLLNPSTGTEDKVYGADYVSVTSHDTQVTGTLPASDVTGLAAVATSGLASDLTNDVGWITSAGAPVQSVAGKTGVVTLVAGDVGLGSVTNDAQTKAAIVPNTAPSAGQILVGNAGGTAYAAVSMSGGATIASTGAVTVTKQMSISSDGSGLKLDGDAATPGNSKYYGTNSSGTKGFHAIPAGTGDVIADDVSTTVQNIVAYNSTDGLHVTELTGTQGDVLYHNGTSWAKLGAGTSGHYLKTNGAAANPAWAAVSSGGLQTIQWFGDGSDGDVTVSSGTTTLTRDMFYNNLTISGTGNIDTANYRIFVKGTLDLTAAPANAIHRNGANGNNASTTTGGGAPTNVAAATSIQGANGIAGRNGGTTNGTAGISTSAVNRVSGGEGGAAGAGGNGTSGSGGAAGVQSGTPKLWREFPSTEASVSVLNGVTNQAGGAGATGGSGGGDTTAGGGSGGSGQGGGSVWVYANTISRGGSTATGAISSKGGNGGNGASPAAGNRGGGAGSGGGGGGLIVVHFATLSGSSATNAITADGGAGGNGASGTGTGTAGGGATGGNGGRIMLFNLTSMALTQTDGTSTTGTGPTGTSGGAGATCQASL